MRGSVLSEMTCLVGGFQVVPLRAEPTARGCRAGERGCSGVSFHLSSLWVAKPDTGSRDIERRWQEWRTGRRTRIDGQ
jgi:hypothetical protein